MKRHPKMLMHRGQLKSSRYKRLCVNACLLLTFHLGIRVSLNVNTANVLSKGKHKNRSRHIVRINAMHTVILFLKGKKGLNTFIEQPHSCKRRQISLIFAIAQLPMKCWTFLLVCNLLKSRLRSHYVACRGSRQITVYIQFEEVTMK